MRSARSAVVNHEDELGRSGSAAGAARHGRTAPRGRVVVVTGASGGLGRAIALEFARRRSALVLGARRTEALEDTARGCRTAGGEAITLPTDVTREQDVIELAAAALDRWDRIDVWVNNAGVTLFALLEQAPF